MNDTQKTSNSLVRYGSLVSYVAIPDDCFAPYYPADLPADASDILTPAVHARLRKAYRLDDEARGELQTTITTTKGRNEA